jgi:hypothetical protein
MIQTRTNIQALSGIRTQGLCVQAIEAYVPDRAATGTGVVVGVLVIIDFVEKLIFA